MRSLFYNLLHGPEALTNCTYHINNIFSFSKLQSKQVYLTTVVKVKVAQSCPTLCNPVDYRVHGTLQARILEWVAVPFSRGSSQTRGQTQVSGIAGRFFTS